VSEPHVVDCLGQPCPVPVIELARAIAGVPLGAEVVVLSDDPAAGPDIQAWCRMRGHSFEGAAGTAYTVRRVV
jgi:tRNA 2-thiouridine synthesizing protein A